MHLKEDEGRIFKSRIWISKRIEGQWVMGDNTRRRWERLGLFTQHIVGQFVMITKRIEFRVVQLSYQVNSLGSLNLVYGLRMQILAQALRPMNRYLTMDRQSPESILNHGRYISDHEKIFRTAGQVDECIVGLFGTDIQQ